MQGFNRELKRITPAIPNFVTGVDFAENELQNLAIEFADWLAIYYDYGHSEEYWFGHDGKYTSSELFKKFIEQRTK